MGRYTEVNVGINVTPRVVCRTSDHANRFRGAIARVSRDRQESPEWLAALFLLAWLGQGWVDALVRGDADVLNHPPEQRELRLLYDLAFNLFNGDEPFNGRDLAELGTANFDVAVGAIIIRRNGTRVLSWLEARTQGTVTTG